MKKICIFTAFTLPHLGGVERYTDKLIKELKNNKNIDITVVKCNIDDNKEYISNYNDCRLYSLPTYKIFRNRYPIIKKNKTYRKLIKEIKKDNYDAYICQTRFYFLTQIGAKIAHKSEKNPIVIEHGSSHLSIGNVVLDFFGKILEHFLTWKLKKYKPRYYGVSERCNNWLKHFKISASGVLYNSVNNDYMENEVEKKNNKIMFTYVGRIIEAKGIRMLLDAFSKLEKEYKNISLHIAGDGELLSELKNKYKSKNVYFEGKLEYKEVFNLLHRSDVFVHPSMYPEGLPTSILEAGINKNAIIATDRGGTIEVINDKKLGIIIEENEQAVYDAMKYLIKNPDKINKYKNNIYTRINENFTWHITANKLLEEIAKYEKN